MAKPLAGKAWFEAQGRRAARGAAQAATAKQSPHPEYDKGFSDGWNRCEARQAAAPAQAGEYPKFPERPMFDAVYCQGNPVSHGYSASQVRAMIDADRAARAVYSRSMDLVRVFWQQHTQAYALSMTMAELHNDVELVIRAARGAAQAAPRNGALAAPAQPVAWLHDCAALLTNDVELWIDACPHCGKPHNAPQPAAAQPGFALVPITPTEAMVDAAADAYMPFGDMQFAVQMAILAAPPAAGE